VVIGGSGFRHFASALDPRVVPNADVIQVLGAFFLGFAFFPGSGYIEPGAGYFGITMSTSGFGIVVMNIFMAFTGGTLGGAVLSYARHGVSWVLAGPVAGALAVGTIADVAQPWQTLVISLFAPGCALLARQALDRLGIDDSKLGYVFLGPAVYGIVLSGFVAGGVRQGGFFGLTGTFAFQGARVSVGMQVLGLVIVAGAAVVLGGLVWLVPRRVLRIDPEVEERGLDTVWLPPASDTEPSLAAQEPMQST
jgi:Amt family ammonium transporter